jgi:cobalamin biosynthesis protein CobW
MRRVPATIVTGFLGAGKTSLIRHLLAHAGGRRLAVIVNEFGELGIDRELILGCGEADCAEDDIVELANGCLCCTVAEEFLPALERLFERERPPEHILVETSGLALPKPLLQAFAWPEIRTRTTVDGVLAVVDAAALHSRALALAGEGLQMVPHDNPVEEVFADQLAVADLVILNKADLLEPSDLAALQSGVEARLRDGVRLLAGRHGSVPAAVALGLSAAAEDDLLARPTQHELEGEHDHEDFESFIVGLGAVEDERAFLARLSAVVARHAVLRVKGFVDEPGRPRRRVVEAVGPRVTSYFDRPWREGEERATRLVVIGERGLDRAAIEAALES